MDNRSTRDDADISPLLRAARNGEASAFSHLMRAEADVNVRAYGGMTALMWWVHHGNVNLIHKLIGAGANVNAVDNAGWTALIYAASNLRDETLPVLLQAGSNVNMRQIIEASSDTGHVVWEPFGGLFSASLAAKQAGRKAFAGEIDPTYFQIGLSRFFETGKEKPPP